MPESRATIMSSSSDTDQTTILSDLSAAIEALEKGKVSAPVRIAVEDGIALEALETCELAALLQRARGLRLITMLAAGENVERPANMRLDKPALHPRVREILDALK